jgi:hypothetical protein
MSKPAWTASGWLLVTMPLRAITSERAAAASPGFDLLPRRCATSSNRLVSPVAARSGIVCAYA